MSGVSRLTKGQMKNEKLSEEEFLGSRDSHSDSGADGGTDRTGNNLMHGVWPIISLTPIGRFLSSHGE
jgi:hypothetical protein